MTTRYGDNAPKGAQPSAHDLCGASLALSSGKRVFWYGCEVKTKAELEALYDKMLEKET